LDRFRWIGFEARVAIGFALFCLLLVNWDLGGLTGLVFLGLGVVAGSMFLAGTWLAIRVFTHFVASGAKPLPTMLALFLALGLKVPVVVGFFIVISGDFRGFQACFMWGVGLVYFSLFGWGLVPAEARKRSEQDES